MAGAALLAKTMSSRPETLAGSNSGIENFYYWLLARRANPSGQTENCVRSIQALNHRAIDDEHAVAKRRSAQSRQEPVGDIGENLEFLPQFPR